MIHSLHSSLHLHLSLVAQLSNTAPQKHFQAIYHHLHEHHCLVQDVWTMDSASESPQTQEPEAEEEEEETVYFEGTLISKQEAFKKILEAVQGMNKSFNP